VAKKKKAKKKQAVKNKGGRPTVFKTEHLAVIYKMCELGATDSDLAAAFGVTRGTINNWKKKHSEVFVQIRAGKNDANENVEKALYQRALGYKCDDVKFATFEGAITDAKKFKKHYPPDIGAIKFFLTNRDPERWKNIIEQGHGDGEKAEPVKVSVVVKDARK